MLLISYPFFRLPFLTKFFLSSGHDRAEELPQLGDGHRRVHDPGRGPAHAHRVPHA